eukprot:2961584-Rhodomonas_salina.4
MAGGASAAADDSGARAGARGGDVGAGRRAGGSEPSVRGPTRPAGRPHSEIKDKKTHAWYRVYGDCVFLSLMWPFRACWCLAAATTS